MQLKIRSVLIVLVFLCGYTYGQKKSISGTVFDENKEPLIGATVIEKGTVNGTTTDIQGDFSLSVVDGAVIQVSYVGFKTQEFTAGAQTTYSITMVEGVELADVVVVGSRGVPRSEGDTPLPIDKVGAQQLVATGQNTFDKALQYTIPSFNTVQTPVNDATSLLDPYEIRNMGPSRTLILVNGKRKNLSSLLYTQTSPGRGETGADISAIPIDAIERVEVLRDGASAQYGSDAIAGVVNVVLKDNPDDAALTLRTGMTGEGDGEMFGLALSNGSDLNGKGFLNYTLDFSKVNLANRPGTVSAEGEALTFIDDNPDNITQEDLSEINEFLSRKPDAGNINGSPETTSAKFLINTGINLSDNAEMYGNAAYVYKKVNSYANYRTPYWRTLDEEGGFPYLADFFPGNHPTNDGGYDGYVPTFDGDLADYNATIGVRGKINEWNHDASLTIGGNQQTYTINNSHNGNEVLSPAIWTDDNGNGIVDDDEVDESSQLYRENSPITFDAGGTRFTHIVGNFDLARKFGSQFSLGFGTEFRSETFTVIEGSLSSYDGGGPDSFAGNRPENSGKFNRYNLGVYMDLSYDVTDNFLLNGTIRGEEYSDFGSAFVWKLSSRYKIIENVLTVRGSVSTGFRAPTLHQIYTQKAQYSFVPGAGIQVGGLVSNVSPQARLLGIDQLDAEESQSFTAGFSLKPTNNVSITVDYYSIDVNDRIVLGTEIGPTESGDTPLDDLLRENDLSDVSFFSNAIDTRTAGVDVVTSIQYLQVGSGNLNVNLSGNITLTNERINDVNNPDIVVSADQSVVNATQEALFFTSRPNTKWILGLNYEVGRFNVSLNNTYFGKTTFKQQDLDENLRTEFIPKIVTDLGINIQATEKLSIAANINNIFNVLPEWKFVAENSDGQELIENTTVSSLGQTFLEEQSDLITFSQRYSQMTYDGYHFSQLGTLFNLSARIKL